jgi:hypothetical protein
MLHVAVSRKLVGKHVSAEIRFLDTNKLFVVETTGVSMDTRKNAVDSWKRVESTGVSMDRSKEQTSTIPQRYISGRPDNRRSRSRKENQDLSHS